MSDALRALQAFFSSLGITACPAGQAPPGAPLPLLLWEMSAGRFAVASQVTATAWFDGPDANILRAAFLDTVLDALPESGLRLPAERALLYLERSSGDFLTPVTDPAHPGLLGGRIRLTLRRYGAN
ncbi:MAG: hypothetical protein IKK21_12175 [Clostridia bacterium]|nr:hypothetical protein [Clostridia bacterium]